MWVTRISYPNMIAAAKLRTTKQGFLLPAAEFLFTFSTHQLVFAVLIF
jgi:hypothetical protein